MLDFLLTNMLLGAVAFGLTVIIDKSMDYGNIFGLVRFFVVYTVTPDLRTQLTAVSRDKDQTFGDRLNAMDNLYWQAAMNHSFLALILCLPCMSAWVCAVVWYLTTYGADISSLPVIIGGCYVTMNLTK